jgi:hypothetical protein
MEGIHQSIKITDGMLRALVQRLNTQIENMDTSISYDGLANVATQLQMSLTQVQRVHEHLEASLARALEHENATKKVADQHRESADSALVTDKLTTLAAIFKSPGTANESDGSKAEGDKLRLLETKLDALITKLDKPDDNSGLSPGSVADAQRASANENETQDSPAIQKISQQLTAMQATLLELKDQTTGKKAARQAAPSPNITLLDGHIAASAPSSLTGPSRKRLREDENETPSPSQPVPLSKEQKKKVRELAHARSLDSFLDKLLPCPDGGLWSPALVYLGCNDRFVSKVYVTKLATFMDAQPPQTWCCARRAALGDLSAVNQAGNCKCCGTYCVQVRRVAADGDPASKYYYARVVYPDPSDQ